MSSPFAALYNTPPTGQIQAGQTSARSTASLSHHLSADLIPNWVVDYSNAANVLVDWARHYLSDNISHQPGTTLRNAGQVVSTLLNQAEVANEGSVVSLYARTVEAYSTLFAQDADSLSPNAIRFRECQPTNSVRADWAWSRNGEIRMIVEHKGKKAFDTYCDEIRNLATATSSTGHGTAIGVDGAGHATGARAILLKVTFSLTSSLHFNKLTSILDRKANDSRSMPVRSAVWWSAVHIVLYGRSFYQRQSSPPYHALFKDPPYCFLVYRPRCHPGVDCCITWGKE